MPESFLERILRRLDDEGVEFLVAGGVSAVLQGAPIVTHDLHLCYRRTRENAVRPDRALAPMHPALRTRGGPIPVELDARMIESGCNFTLACDGEDLDLLGEMGGIGGYDAVIDDAVHIDLDGRSVRLLSLTKLIASKRAVARTKDLAVLPVLEATLELAQARNR
jgi:predicted nucleotidyltransferase